MGYEQNALNAPETNRGRSSIEIYRAVTGKCSWRVIVAAEGNTESALRAAKSLAMSLETEIFEDMRERHTQRRSQPA